MSDDIRERVRQNMERLGIPKGTDHPALLALGATPLYTLCPLCRLAVTTDDTSRIWHGRKWWHGPCWAQHIGEGE